MVMVSRWTVLVAVSGRIAIPDRYLRDWECRERCPLVYVYR